MSECDSTAASAKDGSPTELPESSLQLISIIPLPEDLQFDMGSVEHVSASASEGEDEDHTDVGRTDETPNRSSVRISHRSFTMEYKLNVLDWYYAHGQNKKQTAKHFGVDRKRIRDWLKLEQQLRMEPPSNMQRRKKNTGCAAHYKALDQAMLEWCKKQRTQGQKITNQALRTKALELAPQLGYQDTFKASSNWAVAWRRRNKAVFTDGDEDNQLAAVVPEGNSQQQNSNTEPDITAAINGVPSGASGSSSTQPSTFQTLLDAVGQQVSATNGESTKKINRSEHEQWIALIQQTVDSLVNEFHAKISQIKLLLEHLNSSIQQTPDTCTTARNGQPSSSKVAKPANKRPRTTGTTTPGATKRARKS